MYYYDPRAVDPVVLSRLFLGLGCLSRSGWMTSASG